MVVLCFFQLRINNEEYYILLLASTLFCSDFSERYYKSMDRGIEMFENSETESDYLKTSNLFYRISQVQKQIGYLVIIMLFVIPKLV